MTDEDECHEKGKVQVLPEDKINSIINYMDTEFDRQCIKVIVALNYSRSKIECSGQRAETAKKSLEQVSEIIEECKNTQLAAEDLVKFRWIKKTEDLRSKVKGMTFESRTRREK